MSAVINKAKQHYRRALKMEAVILILLTIGISLWNLIYGFSFLNGSVAILIPHCLFFYWIFFRESAKSRSKMTAFYRGEGIKWLAAILLIVVSFKFVSNLHYIAFFIGYFITLCLNVALPAVMVRRTK